MTAHARPEDRARSLEAGYQAHLSAPVNLDELVRTVAAVAGRAGDGARGRLMDAEALMRLALAEAARARDAGEVPVGAVVELDGRIDRPRVQPADRRARSDGARRGRGAARGGADGRGTTG